MKTVNLNIRINEDMRDQFKELAEVNAQTPSLLIRNWIEEYIEENKIKGMNEMLEINIDNYGYNFGSEILIDERIVKEINEYFDWNDKDKVIRYIETDIVEILEELEEENDELLPAEFEKELSFYYEGAVKTLKYVAKFEISNRKTVVVKIESK